MPFPAGSEIFEFAILTGGNANNTLVVNDSDGRIFVSGLGRAVSDWQGTVQLDNAGSEADPSSGLSYNEYYLIALKGTGARYSINDTGGTTSYNELYILGTPGDDQLTLDAAGNAGFVFSGSLIDPNFPFSASVQSNAIFPTRPAVVSTKVTITGPTTLNSSKMQVSKDNRAQAVTYVGNTGTFTIAAPSANRCWKTPKLWPARHTTKRAWDERRTS